MKIAAISDTHGSLPDIPPCDVFLHAGDICPAYNHTRGFQANWLETRFNPWLDTIDAKHKIVVAGNHDWIFYNGKKKLPELNCIYLENSEIVIDGVKFWGSPWTPYFNDWAFNFRRDAASGAGQARRMWAEIPDDADVVITHGPPLGQGDIATYDPNNHERCGCRHLMERMLEVKPKVHVFGHIHMADCPLSETINEVKHSKKSKTTFYNISMLNEAYKLVGKPTIIEIQ